jgi:hypothetical protein
MMPSIKLVHVTSLVWRLLGFASRKVRRDIRYSHETVMSPTVNSGKDSPVGDIKWEVGSFSCDPDEEWYYLCHAHQGKTVPHKFVTRLCEEHQRLISLGTEGVTDQVKDD